jgi:thiamine-monophosphate kinase
MKLSKIGEFGLIRRFSPPFLRNLPAGVVGIGDDCAVIPWKKNRNLLVTTDMLIENIHFLKDKITPWELGYKSLAANLSDIAAMGGKANSAFLSLGIPPDIEVEWLDEFFKGIRNLAKAENVLLLGGDTTKSSGPLVVNIGVLGEAHPARVKFRSGAKAGDIVCVTGFLGDSGGGLRVLCEGKPLFRDERYLVRCHHRPRPHLAEGAWLATREEVTAMMDVSDGIDSDLRRIMEHSRCGTLIHLDTLPISSPLKRVAKKYGWNPFEIAAAGGEDYCLLATVGPERFKKIASAFEKRFKRPLSRIGVITKAREELVYRFHGKPVRLSHRGFDHFR